MDLDGLNSATESNVAATFAPFPLFACSLSRLVEFKVLTHRYEHKGKHWKFAH